MAASTIIAAFLGALATVISAFFVWIGTRTASEGKKEEVEVTARGPEWDVFFNQVQSWTNQQFEERDKKISTLEAQVVKLETIVGSLRVKYSAALSHILDWRRRHPESVELLLVPDEILDDL